MSGEEQIAKILQAGYYANLADRTAPALPVAGEAFLNLFCLNSSVSRVGSYYASFAHSRFTDISLDAWRKVYTTGNIDNVLVALCTLIATVAASALTLRLVRWRRGQQLTPSAIEREVAYNSVFDVPKRLLQRTCALRWCFTSNRHLEANSVAAQRSAADKRACSISTVAVFAALMWLAAEVHFLSPCVLSHCAVCLLKAACLVICPLLKLVTALAFMHFSKAVVQDAARLFCRAAMTSCFV